MRLSRFSFCRVGVKGNRLAFLAPAGERVKTAVTGRQVVDFDADAAPGIAEIALKDLAMVGSAAMGDRNGGQIGSILK